MLLHKHNLFIYLFLIKIMTSGISSTGSRPISGYPFVLVKRGAATFDTEKIKYLNIFRPAKFLLNKNLETKKNRDHRPRLPNKLFSTYKCNEWVTSTSSTSVEKKLIQNKKVKEENVYVRPISSIQSNKTLKNQNNPVNLKSSKNPSFSHSQQPKDLKKEEIKLFNPTEYFNAQSRRSSQLAGKEKTTLQFKLNNKHFNDLLLADDSIGQVFKNFEIYKEIRKTWGNFKRNKLENLMQFYFQSQSVNKFIYLFKTHPFGTSPLNLSGTPITAQSLMLGCASNKPSNSAGAT
ncbi:hypothetical protein Mgra_00005220 [Meloidogyne graminicola]|uniref:Uncharacterized protein n=1 Tax=Meloidogyne graminicola TaxID=189291 RepID=A0A8S9ZPP6_9BILA|nr:hypothetical protein Mgra_00005220 [Meloidogyne graminicola]